MRKIHSDKCHDGANGTTRACLCKLGAIEKRLRGTTAYSEHKHKSIKKEENKYGKNNYQRAGAFCTNGYQPS